MIAIVLKYLTPYLAKIGIAAAILAVALGLWLYVSRLQSELHAANETIAADSAKCALTQATAAATINTTTQAVIDGQRINLDTAQNTLQIATVASQSAGAATIATVQAQATQPGQDGVIPPVLVQAVNSLRGAP